MDYDNTDSGVLFFNEESKDKQPDWTGSFNYKGEDFKLAGWIRHSKKTGKEFISLKVDTYEPQNQENKGKDSDSWQQARAKFSKQEELPVEDDNEEINLADIPF